MSVIRLKAKDTNFVNETLEAIVESLFDWPDTISNIIVDKNKEAFYVKFNLKCSKTGDLCWMLMKDWMSLIAETEEKLDISIDEAEQDGSRMIYKFIAYRYTENRQTD